MPIRDWFARGSGRRLRRAVETLETAFGSPVDLDRAAPAYREVVLPALAEEPPLAKRLFDDYDARIPDALYPFQQADETRLAALGGADDTDVLDVLTGVALRVPLPAVAAAAMARACGRDADALIVRLRRWRADDRLDRSTLTAALADHVRHRPLERDAPAWTGFFGELPAAQLPELFEVAAFRGDGMAAVRLADSADRQRIALRCCADSDRLADVEAGIELAQRVDREMLPQLRGRAGEVLFSAGRFEAAIEAFTEAGRPDRVSACHERLGRFPEALASCSDGDPERVLRLAVACRPEVDALVERGEFAEAARLVGQTAARLAAVGEPATAAREEAVMQRAAVLAAARRHYAESGDDAAWSGFEEDAGEPAEAALRAEAAGDAYRASRLFRRAGRFGDAERVLRGDTTAAALAARAGAREAGGDLIGAAGLHARNGSWGEAVELAARAGEPVTAASYLIRWRGAQALDDPRLADWLRRGGQHDTLARLCLDARGTSRRAADELRLLRAEPGLADDLRAEVVAAVDELDAGARRAFDARAQAWVAQARFEVDRRFAGIWALDLGTTSCVAAIYDGETERVVLCPWKGRTQFASTLSVDRAGNELIGLAGEETLANWLVGHISGAKRRMGTRSTYKIRGQRFRPEEVAARLIRHGREMVESFLAGHVRERVAELAREAVGEVRDEWLDHTERQHDLRLDRPRALLTIPAYFLNNQKHATRDACRIAGVELVRLIHEPTAACMAAARERRISGRIVVVDLGAGTLDVSSLEVEDGVYDVQQVLGDNHYGGSDFDGVIAAALVERLRADGVEIAERTLARRRLAVAAEYLKVALSAQEHAEYLLRDLADGRDVRLELSRAELAAMLAEPLDALRRTCREFAGSLRAKPERLVLVGGPMLSSLVQEVVEEVFGLKRTQLPDPRTAVATGAALQAAVLDGRIAEVLLLDVIPLPLGLRAVDKDGRHEFSELIARNARIPTQAKDIYTTREDGQTDADIEIFNGSLDPAAKIGQFRLGELAMTPEGRPRIEVTFAVDPSCVLEVTAQDLTTGRSRSIRISDTTLLSPGEIDDMARRRERQAQLEELRGRLAGLVDQASGIDVDVEAAWGEFRDRLGGYRRDAGDPQRAVVAMLEESPELQRETEQLTGTLRDLAGSARGYLARDAGQDPSTALSEGQHQARELRERLDRLRERLDRVAGWNALLARQARRDPDPLQRFRGLHDLGDWAGALAAVEEVELTEPADVERRLRCLAGTGDVERYRAEVSAAAGTLGVVLPDVEGGAPGLAGALVEVARLGVEGHRRGFRVRAGVLTGGRWLADVPVDHVSVDGAAVQRIERARSSAADVALLRRPDDGEGPLLRVGAAGLVRIGDRVWTPAPQGSAPLLSGVVDRFEAFPEQGLRLFRVGLALPASAAGGPVLSELGEVVGIVTGGEQPAGASYVLSADAFAGLLDDA